MGDSEIIRQPYRFTMAIHKLSVLQKRVLTQIIKALQEEMGAVERGTPLLQLPLFTKMQLDTVVVRISKSSLVVNQNNYTKVKKALIDMMGDAEEFVLPATNGKEKATTTVITRFIERYKWDSHSKDIAIYMYSGVAEELLKITGGYTKYQESVMMLTNNSYTQRLYEFICHWRDLPVKSMSVLEFRNWLKLQDVYPDTWKLVQKVIKPAQKELKVIADIYFEFSVKKSGGVITHFNFVPKQRLTLEESEAQLLKQREWLINTLRIAFQFKDRHFTRIAGVLIPAFYKAITEKLEYLNEFVVEAQKQARNGHRETIGSVPDYVAGALLKEFAGQVPGN